MSGELVGLKGSRLQKPDKKYQVVHISRAPSRETFPGSSLSSDWGAFVQSVHDPQPSGKIYQPRSMASSQDTAGLYAQYHLTQVRLAQSRAKDTIGSKKQEKPVNRSGQK